MKIKIYLLNGKMVSLDFSIEIFLIKKFFLAAIDLFEHPPYSNLLKVFLTKKVLNFNLKNNRQE